MVRRRTTVALGLLVVSLCLGCAASSGSKPASTGTGQATKTIALGASQLDPDDLTMSPSDRLAFVNTAFDPLRVEFIQPADQTGKITCGGGDAKTDGARAGFGTFRTNAQGHMVADMAPGRFPGVCALAPGQYTYTVTVVNAQINPSELKTAQEGTITVK